MLSNDVRFFWMKIFKSFFLISLTICAFLEAFYVHERLGKVLFFIYISIIVLYILIYFLEGFVVKLNTLRIIKSNKNIAKFIEKYEKRKYKSLFYRGYKEYEIGLIFFYMLNDDAFNAKRTFFELPKINKNKRTLYLRFIIALADNDKEEIEYFYNLLMSKSFYNKNKIRDIASRIMTMINTGIIDKDINEMIDNSPYPLLKKVLRKYKGEDVSIESLHIGGMTRYDEDVTSYDKKDRIISYLRVLFIIIVSFTPLLAKLLVELAVKVKDPILEAENVYYSLKFTWIYLVLALLPIGNIVYSIFLEKRGFSFKYGLIISIVVCGAFLIYGTTFLRIKDTFSDDKQYLKLVEIRGKIDFPDEFTIFTEKDKRVFDDIKLHVISVVRFESDEKIDLDERWLKEFSITDYNNEYDLDALEIDECDYYFVYCRDYSYVNPSIFIPGYKYYFFAYNIENNYLIIHEFC